MLPRLNISLVFQLKSELNYFFLQSKHQLALEYVQSNNLFNGSFILIPFYKFVRGEFSSSKVLLNFKFFIKLHFKVNEAYF